LPANPVKTFVWALLQGSAQAKLCTAAKNPLAFALSTLDESAQVPLISVKAKLIKVDE